MRKHQILCEHYGRMLGLTEGWKVSGVDLRLEDKRLELRLAWERGGAICPECGASMNRHDLSPERKWRYLDSMGFETILLARIPMFCFRPKWKNLRERLQNGPENGARNGNSPPPLYPGTKSEHPAPTPYRAHTRQRPLRPARHRADTLLPMAKNLFRKGNRCL